MGFGGASQANPLLSYQTMANTFAAQQQQQAYAEEAGLYREQANIVSDEANMAALQKTREVKRFAAEQAETYLAGGVLLDGTPLAVIEETRQLGQQEIDALRRSGAAHARLLRMKADQMERGGFQTLWGAQTNNMYSQIQNDQQRRLDRAQRLNSIVSTAFKVGGWLLK